MLNVLKPPSNMLDPIQQHFGYSQLWPLRPVCSQNQAGSYMLDLTCHIRFGSVFPKKALTMLCKTNLGLIWMAWSGSGQTHLVRKHASVQELSGSTSPCSAVVSASDCGSEGLGFESHQSHVGFFGPGRLLPRAGSAMGPVGRLEPHSRASST